MEDACSLRAVRDGAWRDPDHAASYRRQAAELGWYSMLVPEEHGGGSVSGNGLLDAALIAWKRGAALQPGSFVGTNVVAHALAEAGSDEVRAEVLPALLSGDAPASWAVTSVGEGGRLDGGVVSRPGGDGGMELSGSKTAVQDVEDESWLLVTCAGPDGPMQVLIAAGAPGVTVTERESLDITRRFADVTFDGARVAPQRDPRTRRAPSPSCSPASWRSPAPCSPRRPSGRWSTTSRPPSPTPRTASPSDARSAPSKGIKHQLADTSLALEMSKAVALAAARTVGSDDDHGPQAASMAKAFVGDAGIELVQTCFQVFGGIGYTWEHDQHLYLRRVTTDAGLFGDAAWHREHLCQLASG